jgi:hypothetical protein
VSPAVPFDSVMVNGGSIPPLPFKAVKYVVIYFIMDAYRKHWHESAMDTKTI